MRHKQLELRCYKLLFRGRKQKIGLFEEVHFVWVDTIEKARLIGRFFEKENRQARKAYWFMRAERLS